MCVVWTVTTIHKDGRAELNCICESEEKAQKEKAFLEKAIKDFLMEDDNTNSPDTDIESIEIDDWFVL